MLRILFFCIFALANTSFASYIPTTDMAIHFRDGHDNELLGRKRLMELDIAFESGKKEWEKKRSSIFFDCFVEPILFAPFIALMVMCSREIYKDSCLSPLERYAILVPTVGITLILSLALPIMPFTSREKLRKQADIYKRELELLRINVELEQQHAKSFETEELLNKIDHALAELAKFEFSGLDCQSC